MCECECRILQYGQMSMSSEATEGDQRVTKAYAEAGGDQGLLNLLLDDTVFFVGGYPKTFKVSAWSLEVVLLRWAELSQWKQIDVIPVI